MPWIIDRAWGIPAVLARGIPGKALRAFPGSSRIFSGISSAPESPSCPEGPKIKKNRDFERDWKFRARMKFSSEPLTAALFFVGHSRRRDWNFRARLKVSIEIKNFDRDWIFLIVGPSGCTGGVACFVVPGLTGPKSLCVRLETQEI